MPDLGTREVLGGRDPLGGWLSLESFRYTRERRDQAVLQLLGRIEDDLGAPADAVLVVQHGCNATRQVPRPGAGITRTIDDRALDPVGLLWKVSFSLPLEVVEYAQARFELQSAGRIAIALPAPQPLFDHDLRTRDARPPRLRIARVRRHLVALGAGFAVAAVCATASGGAMAGTTPGAIDPTGGTTTTITATTPADTDTTGAPATTNPATAPDPAGGVSTPEPPAPTPGPPATVPATTTGPATLQPTPTLTATTASQPAPTNAPTAPGPSSSGVHGSGHGQGQGISASHPAHGHGHRPIHTPGPNSTGRGHGPAGHAAPGHRAPGGAAGKHEPHGAGHLRGDHRHGSHRAHRPGAHGRDAAAALTALKPAAGSVSSNFAVSTGSFSLDPSAAQLSHLATAFASNEQPPAFLIPIYKAAGHRYGVDWRVLAAINAIETDFGRNLSVSSAGAIGWMQFMPATWAEYGIAVGGHGQPNPYDPTDAIFAAAHYLAANGAARDIRGAIFAYNHATWYVDAVMWRAETIVDGGGPALHPSGYALPLDARYMHELGRTDDGVDIESAPDGVAVYSITPGVVTGVAADPSGFGPNYPVVLATAGPLAGQDIYYGHVAASLVHAGEHVEAGQPIAVMGHTGDAVSLGHGHIEIGFSDASGNPANHHGAEAWTPAGAAMRHVLVSLSAGFGISNS